MISNGQAQRYKESLKNTQGPTAYNPNIKMDLRGIVKYAKERGVKPTDLSDEELDGFTTYNDK